MGHGWVDVDGLEDPFTERSAGISLQCLIDLQKAGVDTNTERVDALNKLYAMFVGNYSGQVVGAPMRSMNGHECSNHCPNMNYWMFSPWMGSAFLIPALWEHWVFLKKDPRIAQMIVMFGDALLTYGVVRPDIWAPGKGPWRISDNPTPWLTLYFSVPYDIQRNIKVQNNDGWFSGMHNPEAIFALNAAYFFSCDSEFKQRADAMLPFFNQQRAKSDPDKANRAFLWQHRGSASTEWLMENSACNG